MNDAHLHLVVNHFPIILPIVGTIILLVGLFARSNAVKRTGYFLFIAAAFFAIAAMATGEGAEEVAENLPGVTENYIEKHEEVAEIFSLLIYILGGFSILGLWASFTRRSFATVFSYFILVFAMVTLYFAQKTGTTGGEIRHTEIRGDFQSITPPTPLRRETDDDD